jgi:hypothetical protein
MAIISPTHLAFHMQASKLQQYTTSKNQEKTVYLELPSIGSTNG